MPTAPDGSLAGPLDTMLHARWVGDPLRRLGAALTAARALLTTCDLDDDGWDAARAHLGDAGLVELTTLVGYYELLARQMRVFRIRLPDGVDDPFGRSTGA